MEKQYVKLLEQIADLSNRLMETQDKLAETTDTKDYWFNQWQELKLKYEPNTEDF